jgi:hypothetical protein
MTDTTIATPAIRPFHIDDDDRVMLLSEWRQLRRMSKETELRLRKLGLGPQLVHLGPRRLGVTVRADKEWLAKGGAARAGA